MNPLICVCIKEITGFSTDKYLDTPLLVVFVSCLCYEKLMQTRAYTFEFLQYKFEIVKTFSLV